MKGKLVSAKHRQYEWKGETRDVWDVVVDIGDEKKKKYQCHSRKIADLEGKEITYEEQAGREYTDEEGITRQRWTLVLKDQGQGFQKKQWVPQVKDEVEVAFNGSSAVTSNCAIAGLFKSPDEAQQFLLVTFRLSLHAIRQARQEKEENKNDT